MFRLASLLVLLAVSGAVLAVFQILRRPPTLVPSSPSAVLLWRLGKWHFSRQEDVQAIMAYHWAKQAQAEANAEYSMLTPLLLYDLGKAMDATSSQLALKQKLMVYEELASVLEKYSWEDYLDQLTDQTEMIRDIGMAALSLKEVELEMNAWQVSLRLCLATNCGETIRHAEILLRVGVSTSKRSGQDLDRVLEIYEEAERIFVQLDQTAHPLYAILVHNFGATHGQRGDRKGEKDSFEKALRIYRNTTNNYTETYTSLLYEVAMAREEIGDADGGLEAFDEAERAFLHHPNIPERLRSSHVSAIGEMRRTIGNVAGALHAFEIVLKVHERLGTLNSPEGLHVQNSLKEVRESIQAAPQKKQWRILRDLEIHRRPAQPESKEDLEEGMYLQSAGR